MILITRDLNAKVRDDITRKEDAMGWHSCRTIDNTGERFVEFVLTIAFEQWSGKIQQNLDFMAVVE